MKNACLSMALLATFAIGTAPAPAADKTAASVTIVTMSGCRPCEKLKAAFQQSADLRAYKPTFVDMTQFKELRVLRITSFPTLLVRTADETVVYRRSGFDGDAKKLAGELSAALKRSNQGTQPPQTMRPLK